MRRVIGNERGGATLLYVLMVMLILLVLAPAILNAVSNEATRDVADTNQLIATNLAVSGMESFIAYLDTYTTGDRETFALAYPGRRIEPITYTLPDGTHVEYELDINPGDPAMVKVWVRAGQGTLAREKEIKYTINTATSSSGNPYVNTPLRIPVPVTNTGEIYIGGAKTDIETNDIKNAVGKVIDYFTGVVESQIDQYVSGAVTCASCRSVSDITAAVDAALASSADRPVAVYFPNSINLDKFIASFGTSQSPVVLIFNHLTVQNDVTLQLYGNMIVREHLTFHNNADITFYGQSGGYGNFYVGGELYAKNNLDIRGANLMYSDKLTLDNNTDIEAVSLLTATKLTTKNNVELHVGLDIISGKVEANNNSYIKATSGDFYVKHSFTSKNNLDLISGGVIAIGGELNVEKHDSIRTGGGTTTFPIISEPSWTPDGGGPVAEVGWNPTRQ